MQSMVSEVAEQLKKHDIPVWMDIRDGLGASLNQGYETRHDQLRAQ